MRTTLTLAALAVMTAAAAADDAKKAAAQLAGSYTLVSGEKFGQPEPAERIKDVAVRITDRQIVVTDHDKKEVYAAEYTLDAAQKPWRITMTATRGAPTGQRAKGLIEKSGDTVRLIYAEPGGETPTEFKTKDKQLMFVMKKK